MFLGCTKSVGDFAGTRASDFLAFTEIEYIYGTKIMNLQAKIMNGLLNRFHLKSDKNFFTPIFLRHFYTIEFWRDDGKLHIILKCRNVQICEHSIFVNY